MNPSGWHSRGYLPHFNGGELLQMVTFRLYGSLPDKLIQRYRLELKSLPPATREVELRERLEEQLDRGHEPMWLARSEIARMVQDALLHFDGERYHLASWVLMGNHVHALLRPLEPHDLSDILFSWRSYTGSKANEFLNRRGKFWERDYFDRFIRDELHLARAVDYIEMNPVRAGLCATPAEWDFGSARLRERCDVLQKP